MAIKMPFKTHIYVKMLVLKTQIFEKHIFVSMENMKSKIDKEEKIKIIFLFNRNSEWYRNEISFSINNEIYSINSFSFVLHFCISISNSFIQLNEQLISIMK